MNKTEPMVAQSESRSSEKIVRKNVRKKGNASMNKHLAESDLATPKVTTGPIAGSRKIFAQPDAAPELKVPLREVVLDASSGEPPVPVYDPSGPYTDPDATIDVEQRPAAPARGVGPRTRRRRRLSRPPHQACRQRQCQRQAPRPQLCQHAEADAGRRGGGARRVACAVSRQRDRPPSSRPSRLPPSRRRTTNSRPAAIAPSPSSNGRAPASSPRK